MPLELHQRRKFFDDYAESYVGRLPSLAKYKIRFTCPCCGYPTLRGRATDEICYLCHWEDDGQDDHNADESSVPNHLSLLEARLNFVMHEPAADPRIGSSDSAAERDVKLRVRQALESMRSCPAESHDALWETVCAGERELYRLLKRRIREI